MKVKNMPMRKLLRKLKAEGKNISDYQEELQRARNIRTKKFRGKNLDKI